MVQQYRDLARVLYAGADRILKLGLKYPFTLTARQVAGVVP